MFDDLFATNNIRGRNSSKIKSYFLAPFDIDIWYINLISFEKHLEMFLGFLSESETKRANQFHFKKDRNSFIISRGVLRILLGKYLSISPDKILIAYGEHGKPYVKDLTKDLSIEFNLAHTHQTSIFGFSSSLPLGIDLEYIKPIPEIRNIANQYFTEIESQALFLLQIKDQLAGFYRFWTLKEAYIKADGGGLSIPLDSFEITFQNGESPKLTQNQDDVKSESWHLVSLEHGDAIGALAFNDGGIRYFLNYYSLELVN